MLIFLMAVILNMQLIKHNLQSSLSLFYQNIRGRNDKSEELISSLLANSMKPHIICLTEHYTTEQNLLLIYLENYTPAADYSHINCKRGGACLFIIISMFHNLVWKILETPALQINLGKCDLIVICLCRSLSGDFAQLIQSLDLNWAFLSALVKQLEILTVPCLDNYTLMIFVICNSSYFKTNFSAHSVHTRQKKWSS